MTIIYGESNAAARALDEALPGWYVEADGSAAYAYKVDPRQSPDFFDQIEIHALPGGDGWEVVIAEQRTRMGMPEEVDSMSAASVSDVKRAARALKRRWSSQSSISDREFDFTGGAP